MGKKIVYSLMLLGILLSSACSTVGKALDISTRVNLDFTVAENINPDGSGRTSPLVISIFELKDNGAFEGMDFLSLYENAADSLGDNLISVRKLPALAPGKDRQDKLKLNDETRFIGLLAEFSDFEDAKYHLVMPISPHGSSGYYINVSDLSIALYEPVSDKPIKRVQKTKLNPQASRL